VLPDYRNGSGDGNLSVKAPNQLWCMDFKRYFATGDGSRCDPFTITDAHSRYDRPTEPAT